MSCMSRLRCLVSVLTTLFGYRSSRLVFLPLAWSHLPAADLTSLHFTSFHMHFPDLHYLTYRKARCDKASQIVR